jgi:hypothetical protein
VRLWCHPHRRCVGRWCRAYWTQEGIIHDFVIYSSRCNLIGMKSSNHFRGGFSPAA